MQEKVGKVFRIADKVVAIYEKFFANFGHKYFNKSDLPYN